MVEYLNWREGEDIDRAPAVVQVVIKMAIKTRGELSPDGRYHCRYDNYRDAEKMVAMLREDGLPSEYDIPQKITVKLDIKEDFMRRRIFSWPLIGPLNDGSQGVIAELYGWNMPRGGAF